MAQLNLAWILLIAAYCSQSAATADDGSDYLINSLRLADLVPGELETIKLHGNESLSVCGGAEWQVAPHCMQYEYKSTHQLETFVMEKSVFQAIKGEREAMDENAIIAGSQCLSEECTKKVELQAGTWCLVMTNIDEDNRESDVILSYSSCLSEDDKNIFILVLLAVVGGLVALLCLCACICCCIFPCKKQRSQNKDTTMTATVQYHPEMGWYQDPYHHEIYMTPPQYPQPEPQGAYQPLLAPQ